MTASSNSVHTSKAILQNNLNKKNIKKEVINNLLENGIIKSRV